MFAVVLAGGDGAIYCFTEYNKFQIMNSVGLLRVTKTTSPSSKCGYLGGKGCIFNNEK